LGKRNDIVGRRRGTQFGEGERLSQEKQRDTFGRRRRTKSEKEERHHREKERQIAETSQE